MQQYYWIMVQIPLKELDVVYGHWDVMFQNLINGTLV
jgi:hypothetical protein